MYPKLACTLKILTSENFLLIPGFLKCLLMKNPKIVVETCLTFISTNFGTQISGLLPTSYNMSKYLVLKSSDSTLHTLGKATLKRAGSHLKACVAHVVSLIN